jgi:RNA polymerase sigma-70 factor (ECF subfamily)
VTGPRSPADREGTAASFEPTDAELVDHFRNGDQAAFGLLMARHERRVYNIAYRMLGRTEDARDAAQDAFLSCFRHLGAFRGDSAFTTWLHRITVNACYDALRKRPPDPSPWDEIAEPAPARDHADQAVAAVDVQRGLARVPIEFRGALVLCDIQGLPYAEAARVLQVPTGTVKSRLHRGRVALARILRGEPPPALGASKPPTVDPTTNPAPEAVHDERSDSSRSMTSE